jgi:hypothetical protein
MLFLQIFENANFIKWIYKAVIDVNTLINQCKTQVSTYGPIYGKYIWKNSKKNYVEFHADPKLGIHARYFKSMWNFTNSTYLFSYFNVEFIENTYKI